MYDKVSELSWGNVLQKVTGSTNDDVNLLVFLNGPNISSRTTVLQLNHLLTEMSTRNIPGR
jgi:hypothetical protein